MNNLENTILLKKNKLFTYEHACDVSEIILPIEQILKSTGFSYQRIYKDGRRIFLSSDIQWAEYFFDKQFYLTMSFKKYSQLPKRIRWKDWPQQDKSYLRFSAEVKESFNYGNGIVVIKKKNDYLDTFTFRASYEDDNINLRYDSEIERIEVYTEYFLVKAHSIIKDAEKQSLIVNEEMVDLIPGFSAWEDNDDIYSKFFLEQKMIYFINDERYFFTKRETECIRQLAYGRSSKSIANLLNISPKTVEIHLENIKRKLKCHYKEEIMITVLQWDWNQKMMLKF